jgi:hypothetical protein
LWQPQTCLLLLLLLLLVLLWLLLPMAKHAQRFGRPEVSLPWHHCLQQ